ncbi:xylulokinase [Aureimonas endophytica]|uniref:Xylulokinase n=1 Tax=Aureimonas endophytica TaxID=2027858 RepID=A0A916ZXH8_9HYPH|nr:FGGY-family carbohydrate kinase [Aureimonas endophytica]GGE17480.1 xylulokinase [Aureimonas endophytica]
MGEDGTVVGVDSSTQSAKAVVFDRAGRTIAEGRAPIALASPQPGRAEQDPEDWWRANLAALRQATAASDPGRIEAVAISNQRETVAFLDEAGAATHPAIVWLDERAMGTYESFADRLGRDWLARTTGKPIDLIPVAYRLDWLRRHQPEVLDGAARIVDVHAFLTGRLTGRSAATWSSADPFGIFDIHRMDWSDPILEAVGLPRGKLPELVRPGTKVGTITPEAAEATGLPAGIPVFAGGGDGQCAGLGTNAFEPGTVFVNLGTATITGVYSPEPLVGRHWRTMTGPTGEGYFLEAIQKAGAFFVNWVVDTFAGGREDPAVFDRLEREAAALPIGAEGLTMTPHILGVMNPNWDPSARAALVGLSSSHTRAHLYRAALEAITAEIARGVTAMAAEGLAMERMRIIGGGARSTLWLGMIADATGLTVEKSTTVEASALGAGIVAAVGAGWYETHGAAARAMTRVEGRVDPRPDHAEAWARQCARQGSVYENTLAYRTAPS